MTFVRLDLHKRYITACALDARGPLLTEMRSLPATCDAVRALVAMLPAPAKVAVECTLDWACLVEWLERAGHQSSCMRVRSS